jgi:hypothetical protein
MKNLKNTIIILISCLACTQNSKQDLLTKLTFEETLTRLKNGDIQFYYAVYKDSLGSNLSEDLKKKLTAGHLKREFYVDKLDSINKNQQARASEDDFKNIVDIDKVNKNLIISIIEKCGWSNIDTSQINDVFLLIQHIGSEYMARYYPIFLEFHKKGSLSNLNYARMIDRLLMNNGFEQIYGTQTIDHSFYAIRNIGNVNIRRQKLGLDSIQEYAKRSGFEFKTDKN